LLPGGAIADREVTAPGKPKRAATTNDAFMLERDSDIFVHQCFEDGLCPLDGRFVANVIGARILLFLLSDAY
jgi:hypothetical protein